MGAGPAHSVLLLCTCTSPRPPGRDTFIVTLGNAITSILAGFAIFSVLGYMSQELGVPVDQVAKAGGQTGQPRGGRQGVDNDVNQCLVLEDESTSVC